MHQDAGNSGPVFYVRTKQAIVAAASIAAIVLGQSIVSAQSLLVETEAVDNYSACNGPTLSNSIASTDGFRSQVICSTCSPAFTAGGRWTDSLVWTSDFYDGEKTGLADQDNLYFDKQGLAISYYTGHGRCDDRGDVNSQSCATGATCNSPPSGTTAPSFCRFFNGDPTGNCMYHSYSRTLALGNCTSGPSGRSGLVGYSNGLVALGESSNSGNWRGAGTNGGVNYTVLDASCALLMYRESEVFNMFAGVHGVGFVGRLTGDTANISDRGTMFGAAFRLNPGGAVGYAWAFSMNSTAHRNPGSCSDLRGNNLGGGFGVNGCGELESLSLDDTVSHAQGKTTEQWVHITQDFRDGISSASWASVYVCNWDCANNPGRK